MTQCTAITHTNKTSHTHTDKPTNPYPTPPQMSGREKGIYQIFVLVAAAITLAFCGVCYGALLLFHDALNPAPLSYLAVSLAAFIAVIAEGGSRPEEWRTVPGRGISRYRRAVTQRQWLWMTASVALLLVLSRDPEISRAYIVIIEVLALPMFYALNRWGYQSFMRNLIRKRPHWKLRSVVVGPDYWVNEVIAKLGTARNSLEECGVYRIHAESELEHLVSWIESRDIDLLIFPARELPDNWAPHLIALGERRGFNCWLPIELSRRHGCRFNLYRTGDMDLLTPPVLPLANTFNRMMKRAFDLAVSSVVIPTILLPLMVFVKLIHRRHSPGPLFFRQQRMGENGKSFEVIKFRTMNVNNDNEARQATKSDPRIFKGGAMLRKLSLDEFPQFLNVFRGEMSVVGPRPHLACHEREFEQFYERYGMRRLVKPGLTGLAQIRGYRGEVRNPRDVRGRARCDLVYLWGWCMALDLRIIFLTAWQVVRPHHNAY